MNVAKREVVDASGSRQLSAGQKSGCETAINAMHAIFQANDTESVLLIDASNAFNSLNRAASLHNIRIVCPMIATYAINIYRKPARFCWRNNTRWSVVYGYLCLEWTTTDYKSADGIKCKTVLVCGWCLWCWLCTRNQKKWWCFHQMSSSALARALATSPTPRNAGSSLKRKKCQASRMHSRIPV